MIKIRVREGYIADLEVYYIWLKSVVYKSYSCQNVLESVLYEWLKWHNWDLVNDIQLASTIRNGHLE